MKHNPPKFFLRFFRWFCTPDLLTYLEGDLLELFENNVVDKGYSKAKFYFALEVLRLFRPGIVKPFFKYKSNSTAMFRHNILISLRNFQRHKLTFLINLIGLTSGLTCALFIFLWVDHEMSMDKFHTKDQEIYRLVNDGNGNETLLNSNSILVDRLADAIPEIEYAVNSSWSTIDSYLSKDGEFIPLRGEFATSKFFDLFSYPLVSGETQKALERPKSIILSETAAFKIFKSIDVVGNTVNWSWYNYQDTLQITGVFKDIPSKSSEQFDYVLSFDVFEARFGERIERGQHNTRSYFKLIKDTDPTIVERKIRAFIVDNYEDYSNPPFLIPFSSYYLNNKYENGKTQGGRIVTVKLFIVLALMILLIACINFMNFSTARASTRLKEMGVKKVIGSNRKSLIFQHFSESILMNLFAGMVAFGLVITFLPEFREITGSAIFLKPSVTLIVTFILIILASGLFSGIYPALFLSGFSPLSILSGLKSSDFHGKWLRKGLVIFQFCISLVLIVAVVVVQHQVDFLSSKDLGYNKTQLISISTKGLSRNKRIPFIEEIKRLPGIENVSGITHALFGAQRSGANLTWKGKDPENRIWFDIGYAYYNMLEILEIPILYGRTFSDNFGNESDKAIINETALKITGLQNPIGETIKIGERPYEIIGVTKDFHFHSLHDHIRPTIFTYNEFATRIVAKINAQNEQKALQGIKKVYSELNPAYPFEYTFHDQDYQQQYITERRTATISKYFAALAIIISCLGLFGLITFSVAQRKKEISIRKIMGATPSTLFYLLSKDYLALIATAVVIGLPISYTFMDKWLQNFAYHMQLQWHGFILAIGCILILSLLVICIRVIKLSVASPIQKL